MNEQEQQKRTKALKAQVGGQMIIRSLIILLSFSLTAFSQESIEGKIYFGIEDDFEGKEIREFVDFKDAKTGKVSELTFKNGKVPPGIQKLRSGEKVKIRGSKKEEGVVEYDGTSEAGSLQPMEDLRSVTKVNGGGSRSALVVRVNMIDQGQQSCNSEADLQKRIFSPTNTTSGHNVFKDNSYGSFNFTGQVVTVNLQKRTSDYSCSNSQLIQLTEEANAALQAKGIDPYSYDYQQYYIPSNIPCGFGGRAYLGANLGWVRTCSDKTPVHEFGHNFGMGHADSSNSANYSGYGDYSDLMGLRYFELNAPHRDQLGWIPSSKIQSIDVSTKANYKLASLSAATSSTSYLHALKFPHTDTGDKIYFSYRTAVGNWDSSLSSEYKDLLSVHKRESYYADPTMHLQSLDVGEVYTDSKTGITVEVLNKTSSYMEVAVNGGGDGTTPTTDSEAPSLSITNPSDGASVYASSTISASASASDNVGVTRVNFYLNNVVVCQDSSAPYSCSIKAPSSAGGTTVMARAYDAAGNYSNRTVGLTIIDSPTDTTAPSVSITSPGDGASYDIGSTVSVTVAASDNIGVQTVQVWHESYWHNATKTSSGWTYSFPMSEDSTGIRALARDEAGNQQLSDFVNLSVKTATPTDATPPSASITSPSSGAEFGVGSSINIAASASDNVGVTKVVFYAKTDTRYYQVCDDSSAPYSCAYSMPDVESVLLIAQAHDAAGNTGNTQEVTVKKKAETVVDTQAPSVSLTSPSSGAEIKAGASLYMAASASDNVGVTQVVFYVGGAAQCSDSSAPYSCSVTMPTTTGTSVYARAYDAAGNAKISSSVLVKNPEETTTVDTQAPTAPSSLSARVKGKNNVELSWRASSDNVGVSLYRVYRNGGLIGQTSDLGYQEKGPGGSSSYTVKAIDAAGNVSASSNTATISIGGGGDGGGGGGGGKGGGKPEKDSGACRGKKC